MLPTCAVCGLPCGESFSESDDLGNVTGEWLHVCCRMAKLGEYGNNVSAGSLGCPPVFRKTPMRKVRVQAGKVGQSVLPTLPRMQVSYRKVRSKGIQCL